MNRQWLNRGALTRWLIEGVPRSNIDGQGTGEGARCKTPAVAMHAEMEAVREQSCQSCNEAPGAMAKAPEAMAQALAMISC